MKRGDRVRVTNARTRQSRETSVCGVRADGTGFIFSHAPGFSEHATFDKTGNLWIGDEMIEVAVLAEEVTAA
jgi:hypothetical protein